MTGITLLATAAAAADTAQRSLDAALAGLPASHLPTELRERLAERGADRFLVLEAALAVEHSGHDVPPSAWRHLADGAHAQYERRMADYAAGRAQGYPRRPLSDVLASLVRFQQWIPADVFADVETTAQQVRDIVAAALARAGLTDDTLATASYDDLTAAFTPCLDDTDWLDLETLGDACYDLYDWLPTLDVSGERAHMFTLCLWSLLEYQVRELHQTD